MVIMINACMLNKKFKRTKIMFQLPQHLTKKYQKHINASQQLYREGQLCLEKP